MKILGIDTSTPLGSVAILDQEEIISESVLDGSPAYSDKLLSGVDLILSQSGIKLHEIDGFAITTGPGSFTGLRVGLSLLKGMILATEKPFATVNTLEAYAERVEPGAHAICPVLDARKKQVYAALFNFKNQKLVRMAPDQAISPLDLCEQISEPTVFLGNGLDVFGEVFSSRLKENFISQTPIKNQTIAAIAARIASRDLEKNLCNDLDLLTINYVRQSEAELNYTGIAFK